MQETAQNKMVGPDSGTVTKAAPEESYLLQRSWRKLSPRLAPSPLRCWLDPQSGGPEKRVKVLEYTHEQARHTVSQVHATGAAWHYTLAEALEVQRGRDEATRS